MEIIECGPSWSTKGGIRPYETRVILRDGRGQFFYAHLKERVEDAAQIDVNDLAVHPIPMDDIRPRYSNDLTRAPEILPSNCYIKRPSLSSCNPACHYAQHFRHLVMHEVRICELLRLSPHPNIAEHLGCIVEDGRIEGLCFRRYSIELGKHLKEYPGVLDSEQCLIGIKAGVAHLHKLDLVHNDLQPCNIMIHEGQPVLIDFDCCAREGIWPFKSGTPPFLPEGTTYARKENDLYNLQVLADLLLKGIEPRKQLE